MLAPVPPACGAASYLGSKREKSAGTLVTDVDPIIVGAIAVAAAAVSVYMFAQVPAVLWEIGIAAILGSFVLQWFSRKV
jgi:hypothetical protein